LILHVQVSDEIASGTGGAPQQAPLFFLHGFLGSGDNWRTLARSFQPRYLTLCPDARNHGRSPWSGEMSYPLMAGDLFETADSLGLERLFLLGHSMGGKSVMEAALSRPERVRALVVVDIVPRLYPPMMAPYVESLRVLDLAALESRGQAMEALAEAVPDRTIRGFFLKNLEKGEDGRFRWRVNLSGIHDNYPRIWEGLAPGRRYEGPVLFVRGELSDFFQPGDSERIRELFPRAREVTIPGAGHWVHSDRPEALAETVMQFLEGI